MQFLGGCCFVGVRRGGFWYAISSGGGHTIFEFSNDQVSAKVVEAVKTGKVLVCCLIRMLLAESVMCRQKVELNCKT